MRVGEGLERRNAASDEERRGQKEKEEEGAKGQRSIKYFP